MLSNCQSSLVGSACSARALLQQQLPRPVVLSVVDHQSSALELRGGAARWERASIAPVPSLRPRWLCLKLCLPDDAYLKLKAIKTAGNIADAPVRKAVLADEDAAWRPNPQNLPRTAGVRRDEQDCCWR